MLKRVALLLGYSDKDEKYKQHPYFIIKPEDVKEYLPEAINDLF